MTNIREDSNNALSVQAGVALLLWGERSAQDASPGNEASVKGQGE
jgi:hypothetical protein